MSGIYKDSAKGCDTAATPTATLNEFSVTLDAMVGHTQFFTIFHICLFCAHIAEDDRQIILIFFANRKLYIRFSLRVCDVRDVAD